MLCQRLGTKLRQSPCPSRAHSQQEDREHADALSKHCWWGTVWRKGRSRRAEWPGAPSAATFQLRPELLCRCPSIGLALVHTVFSKDTPDA